MILRGIAIKISLVLLGEVSPGRERVGSGRCQGSETYQILL